MEPTPIFAQLTDVAPGVRADGARSVMDLIRAVDDVSVRTEPAPVDEPRVGHVPGVLSFRLPA